MTTSNGRFELGKFPTYFRYLMLAHYWFNLRYRKKTKNWMLTPSILYETFPNKETHKLSFKGAFRILTFGVLLCSGIICLCSRVSDFPFPAEN